MVRSSTKGQHNIHIMKERITITLYSFIQSIEHRQALTRCLLHYNFATRMIELKLDMSNKNWKL